MLVDSFASHCEDCARLKADRLRRSIATKVVEEVFEVLCRRLWGRSALEYAFWRGPLRPARILFPGNAVPKVEELHGAVRISGDTSWLGVEGYLFHLECREIDMIIDAALGE